MTTETAVRCYYCEGKGTRNEQTFDYSSGKLVVGRGDVECSICHGAGSLHPLIAELCEAAGRLSYYNAGEGDCYRNESGARMSARDQYNAAYAAAEAAGVIGQFNKSHYLV